MVLHRLGLSLLLRQCTWPIWGIQIGAILEEATSESYTYQVVPMDLAPPLKVTDYLG